MHLYGLRQIMELQINTTTMKHLIFLFLFASCTSCDLIPAIAPDDFYYHPPAPEPIIVDTCDEYITITQPPFVTLATNLDVAAFPVTFIHKNQPIDLAAFLATFGTDVHVYLSGQNIAATVSGTNNHTVFNSSAGRVFAIDGNGTKTAMVAYKQSLNFHGAVTPDQYYDELTAKPSARYIGSFNTAFSCEEWEQVIQFLADNCIDGTSKIFDARFIQCWPDIDPELKQYLVDADWTVKE